VTLFAPEPPAGMPAPRVDIRFPRRLLILPIVFVAFLASVVLRVVDRSVGGATDSDGSLSGVVLMVAMVGLLPLFVLVGYARSFVRSEQTVLRVRSGFRTRAIPADEIDGFVMVDRSGARCSAWFGARPAIALRPGSPSAPAGTPADNDARALVRAVSNRRGNDLPLACVPPSIISRRRLERALTQLSDWHRSATLGERT
jgi:hypothetical protein